MKCRERFQQFIQSHPLLAHNWADFVARWQNARSLMYAPDNAFEWAFDLCLIDKKVRMNIDSFRNDWRICIVPRSFAIGDDIDASIVQESLTTAFVSKSCRDALEKNLFVLPASSIQGLNWLEADKELVESAKEQELIILKGYGNFLCAAPHGLQLERFHLFVPKGFAGRRLVGDMKGWSSFDICPPLLLRLTGKHRIGSNYPKIKEPISEFIAAQNPGFFDRI